MPKPYREIREAVRGLLQDATVEVDQDTDLEFLRTLTEIRRALESFENSRIGTARAHGHDWAEIGAAMGMTGQAAGQLARRRGLADQRADRTRGPYGPRKPKAERPRASEKAVETGTDT